jgi:transcriptional regulator with XRE-family HTH domain
MRAGMVVRAAGALRSGAPGNHAHAQFVGAPRRCDLRGWHDEVVHGEVGGDAQIVRHPTGRYLERSGGADGEVGGVMSQCGRAGFPHRLRTLRQARRMTQRDLAGTELSVSYISLLESGQRQPTEVTLRLLAAALQCEVKDLVGSEPGAADPVVLLIKQAELALESGQSVAAREQFERVLDRADIDLGARTQALIGRAQALRRRGDWPRPRTRTSSVCDLAWRVRRTAPRSRSPSAGAAACTRWGSWSARPRSVPVRWPSLTRYRHRTLTSRCIC